MNSKQKMGKKMSSGPSSGTPGLGLATGMNEPFKPSKEQVNSEMQFRIEDDLKTLHRAHQIITNKPRHAAVKAHAADVFKAAGAAGISKSTFKGPNQKKFNKGNR